MAERIHIGVGEISRYFEELEDPRSPINRLHPLPSVMAICILAVLAGAGGPTAIAEWADLKKEILPQWLDLPHGVPAKDVYRRVLSALKPEAFRACFVNWLKSLRDSAEASAEADGDGHGHGHGKRSHMAVDGKTARRSHDRRKGLGALHLVSVWATRFGLSLGQVAADERSNEITAIPELLRLVDTRGAIITIDAMGTQKEIAKQIVDGGADYVLALKGNQQSLHEAVIERFNEQMENDFADVDAQQHETHEKGHGREETRTYYQMPAPADLPGLKLWQGLLTIGMVISVVWRNGVETRECRCFISSLPMDVKQFAWAVRAHWGIENSCHWSLDVTYREDESRIREEFTRENFAWLNRFTLSLLKQHPGRQSIAMKRRSCGWSDDFLTQVVTGKAT